MYKLILTLLLGILLTSCIQDPLANVDNNDLIDKNSAIIVCEGLFGYNNANISVFSLASGKVNNDIFKQVNGYDLGDIANSGIIIDTCLFVIVSTSRVLYKISLNNFKVLKILTFPSSTYPRQLIAKDSYLYVSEAYTNKLYKINHLELKMTDSLIVGAQPEGLCILNNFLYVANSGWGEINSSHPEASTIYKIDITNFKIISKVKTYPNPVEIIADSINNKLILTYYNLPSQKDSVGGIIEYDNNLLIKKQFRGNFLKTKILNQKQLLSLIDNNPSNGKHSKPGLALIDLDDDKITTIMNNTKKTEFWYNFVFDPINQQIWICNAMDFQSNGKIEIYNTNLTYSKMELTKIFYTGLNPNQILLWK